jgi:hypothetical protein
VPCALRFMLGMLHLRHGPVIGRTAPVNNSECYENRVVLPGRFVCRDIRAGHERHAVELSPDEVEEPEEPPGESASAAVY